MFADATEGLGRFPDGDPRATTRYADEVAQSLHALRPSPLSSVATLCRHGPGHVVVADDPMCHPIVHSQKFDLERSEHRATGLVAGSTFANHPERFSNCLQCLFALHQRLRCTNAPRNCWGARWLINKKYAACCRWSCGEGHSFPVCSLCAYVVTGMNEMTLDEIRIARITAIAFAALWIAMLGLYMLSGS